MLTVKDINLLTSELRFEFLDTLTNIELITNTLDELKLMFYSYLLDRCYELDNNYLA